MEDAVTQDSNSADLKPTAPLKSNQKMREDEGESMAVNASNESKSLAKEVEVSPDEILKLEEAKNAGDVKERDDRSGGDEHADMEMEEDEGKDQNINAKNEDHKLSLQGSASGTSTNNETQNKPDTKMKTPINLQTVKNPVDEESSRKQSEKEGDSNSADLKPTAPLKSNQKMREDEGESMAVNASNESKSLAKEAEVSPEEILKLEEAKNAGDVNERGDRSGGDEHADMEMEEDEGKDQEMDSKNGDHKLSLQGSASGTSTNNETQSQPDTTSNSANLKPREPLIRNQKMREDEGESIAVNKSNESKSLDKEVSPDEISNLEIGDVNERGDGPGKDEHTDMEMEKDQEKNQDHKSGLHEFKWIGVCVLLVALAFGLYQNLSVPNPPNPKQFNVVDVFNQEMEKLKTSFPSQRPELWRRSLIHLRRHLKTEWPTEPVSLILTSGHGAERTLGCLAQCLAQAFSTAKNSSVLNINGKSKASQDSDQVKMDIDSELRTAFEGQQFAAVIHRFEELPPGSTLIFYRYCDHENAAFKNVFLAFTVMLDAEAEVPSSVSLGGVEDMVYDHLKQKFVSSGKAAMFNQMDVDKLSGLWSRISHVILPVVAEEKTEQQGCGNCDQ